MSNPLNEITKLGQSIWFDNIQRRSLENGEMKSLIEHDDVRGVTSNPSIFNNAISNSDDYDMDLRLLAGKGLSSQEIFWKLAIDDIKKASDLFRPIYDQTSGIDGFVSLEVNPDLAYQPAETLLEAKRLWTEVNRPNLMIKIPATKECIPAIKNAISAGININVTLIFSIERYKQVMNAYLEGLQNRVSQGRSISKIASVASFFISRIDSKIDPKLSDNSKLRGQAAIANAKLAYHEFNKMLLSTEFSTLKELGGQYQRPLWASTSTKNKNYPDTLYVEELIGPNTVNTVPPVTLDAFRDHGIASITLNKGLQNATKTMESLASESISMKQITDELEIEGVKAFKLSFIELLEAIERKRK